MTSQMGWTLTCPYHMIWWPIRTTHRLVKPWRVASSGRTACLRTNSLVIRVTKTLIMLTFLTSTSIDQQQASRSMWIFKTWQRPTFTMTVSWTHLSLRASRKGRQVCSVSPRTWLSKWSRYANLTLTRTTQGRQITQVPHQTPPVWQDCIMALGSRLVNMAQVRSKGSIRIRSSSIPNMRELLSKLQRRFYSQRPAAWSLGATHRHTRRMQRWQSNSSNSLTIRWIHSTWCNPLRIQWCSMASYLRNK